MTKKINKPELAILNDVFVTVASQILNSLTTRNNQRGREHKPMFFQFFPQKVNTVHINFIPGKLVLRKRNDLRKNYNEGNLYF